MLPCLFWGRCQIPRLGVSCSSGAAFRVCFCFAFFGGDAKSLAWLFLARRVLTKWMVMGSVYLENCLKQSPVASLCALLSLTCYGPPFCSPKMSKICQDFRCVAKCCLAFFGGRCQIPRLGVSCSSGAAFRIFFFAFFGGDAKSLAWVFLARRVLPFVFGFNMIGYTAIWNNRSWTKIASLRYPAMPPPV